METKTLLHLFLVAHALYPFDWAHLQTNSCAGLLVLEKLTARRRLDVPTKRLPLDAVLRGPFEGESERQSGELFGARHAVANCQLLWRWGSVGGIQHPIYEE